MEYLAVVINRPIKLRKDWRAAPFTTSSNIRQQDEAKTYEKIIFAF